MASLFHAHLLASLFAAEGMPVRMASDGKWGFKDCCLCADGLSAASVKKEKSCLFGLFTYHEKVDPFCPKPGACVMFVNTECDFNGYRTTCGQRGADLPHVNPHCHIRPSPDVSHQEEMTVDDYQKAVGPERNTFKAIIESLAEAQEPGPPVQAVYLPEADGKEEEVVFQEGGNESEEVAAIVQRIESKCLHENDYKLGAKDHKGKHVRIELWHSLCGSCRLESYHGDDFWRIKASSPIKVMSGSRFADVCNTRVAELGPWSWR